MTPSGGSILCTFIIYQQLELPNIAGSIDLSITVQIKSSLPLCCPLSCAGCQSPPAFQTSGSVDRVRQITADSIRHGEITWVSPLPVLNLNGQLRVQYKCCLPDATVLIWSKSTNPAISLQLQRFFLLAQSTQSAIFGTKTVASVFSLTVQIVHY